MNTKSILKFLVKKKR